MNLKNKKKLIARVLGVGTGRIVLSGELEQIKEAITRQDIRDLEKQGIIKIKEGKGRRKKKKIRRRKGDGSIRKKRKNRDYVITIRKLKRYARSIKNKIGKKEYYDAIKKIKTNAFSDLSHLKEYIRGGQFREKKLNKGLIKGKK